MHCVDHLVKVKVSCEKKRKNTGWEGMAKRMRTTPQGGLDDIRRQFSVFDRRIYSIEFKCAPLLRHLKEHKLCTEVEELDDVKRFLEMHVFAVWDFMSLLKALQMQVTLATADSPWAPARRQKIARLINEAMAIYESDTNERGERQSNFSMYLDAMTALGAHTNRMKKCMNIVNHGAGLDKAMAFSGAPKGAADYVRGTFSLVDPKGLHKVAASLAFGRVKTVLFERILEIVSNSPNASDEAKRKLRHYMNRQAELYTKYYRPLSFMIVEEICNDDEACWREAEAAAILSVRARIALWDATHNMIFYRRAILEDETELASELSPCASLDREKSSSFRMCEV
jgi:hypothetical protein